MKNLRLSEFEESRFGVRTARVECVRADDVPLVLEFAAEHGVAMLIARCDAADPGAAQALEDAGARLMDTLIYYERDLERRPPDASLADERMRPLKRDDPADLEAMAAIARSSFADYYGHYHADSRLDRRSADEAYVDWAVRSGRGELADQVIVAEVDGEPAGFGTFRVDPDGAGDFVLAAVSPDARQHGLYRAIAAAGMLWTQQRGATRYYSSTQIGNIAVQKVWCRLGMEPARAITTFHLWR